MSTQLKKPPFTSHYLVLKDLIVGVDVRQHSDVVHYLTSRIENIKNDFVNQGLLFDEDAKEKSRYSYYKPYLLIQSRDNLDLAEQILTRYGTDKVIEFLEASNSKAHEVRERIS